MRVLLLVILRFNKFPRIIKQVSGRADHSLQVCLILNLKVHFAMPYWDGVGLIFFGLRSTYNTNEAYLWVSLLWCF
jgi:hypothetical protein